MVTLTTALNIVGYISDLIVLLSVITGIVLCIRGVVPVLVRLGNGLSRRKIAIFAKGDSLHSLEDLLHGSKLFNRTNVSGISLEGDVGGCDASVFLVHWADWQESIEIILKQKDRQTAVVIYAAPGSIPQDVMARLGNERNITVCNFRGRLLNDLVMAMITTSYEKK